ncbi:DUF1223 domain-containing protein [Pseudomonas sp.]|uniref:DUF1223 domain-containing protein n=1 Tax=Pseudomonas sp. TaxID=306 RepID=UPI00273671C4|nr:DUF1223 domain-containing protein [Pseudomonas sp.]MDP3817119.1 DUF1223 domain-containing protein [Pseudomonas sp.]
MKSLPLAFATLLLWATASAVCAAPLSFTSGERAVAVLELYSSQGCSSCPPAERWLSALQERPELWSSLIPLAFHVDYWDELGWSDPFAAAGHSARQRAYQRQGGSSAVYTPGFMLGGQEWRGWFYGQRLALPDSPRVGRLNLQLQGDDLTLSFAAERLPAGLKAQVARLGFGLRTAIARGENAGLSLAHDFVVLSVQQASAQDRNHWQVKLQPDPRGERQALVAWLSVADDPTPYQAVGGWLPAAGAGRP